MSLVSFVILCIILSVFRNRSFKSVIPRRTPWQKSSLEPLRQGHWVPRAPRGDPFEPLQFRQYPLPAWARSASLAKLGQGWWKVGPFYKARRRGFVIFGAAPFV